VQLHLWTTCAPQEIDIPWNRIEGWELVVLLQFFYSEMCKTPKLNNIEKKQALQQCTVQQINAYLASAM
jgi:hypothetical protein